MVIFYFIWNFLFYLLSFIHLSVEKNILIKNKSYFKYKRSFKYISFFEKFFLVLFYKKGWFEKSFANLYRKKDIIDYRKINFPIINSFYLINSENEFKIYDISLKFIIKLYKFFNINTYYFNKLKLFFKINKNNNNNLIIFLSINKIFYKKYFNLHDYNFYSFNNEKNLIKFNKIFFLFFLKSSKLLLIYDFNKWYDWYNYNFTKNCIYIKKDKIKKHKKIIENEKRTKLIKFFKNYFLIYKYKNRIKKFNKFFKKETVNFLYLKFNFNNFFKININKDYFFILNYFNYYVIKFSESSISKYINKKNLNNYLFLYLRKNRIFNKGRYSRNRQLYRTGVYWCLWLNIIMVYGLYFIFYRFSFNFGYFWWGILFLAYSTIFSRIIKYNFYNIFYILKEFNFLLKWFGYIFKNLYLLLLIFFKKYLTSLYKITYFYNLKNNNNLFYNNYFYFFRYFYNFLSSRNLNFKNKFIWNGMKIKDNSFFRYKTIIHWFKETYRLITTW